ncbi:hypothetical protein [Roseovarius bejariae]|uniref:hypothetical protein n=1 Tax=Roseovarius bejariae TaxID=2576383 RepID=UPI001562B1A1|nr:hypothetical protein [Roseovarius bejariae]
MEYDKVANSMEIWGYEAKVFYSGKCVQAYPGRQDQEKAYDFGTNLEPRRKFGFLNGKPALREVAWVEGMDGVSERDGGKAVCICIQWLGKLG